MNSNVRLMAVNEAIEVLNRINKTDPDVMRALIFHRVPCSEELANDPTVQVGLVKGEFQVGMLGIINGLYGADDEGFGFILADLNADGTIYGFRSSDNL